MKSEDVRKWCILATCCGLSACSIGICVNSNGVFFRQVSSELDVGIGLFAAQATISNILIGLFSTIAIKTIGRFDTKRIVSSGIIMAGISTALMSRGNSIQFFFVLGALRGIGCSFFSLVVITYIIGNWFSNRQGFAIGLVLSFSGFGGALFSPIFSYLIEHIGWRDTYVIAGCCIIVMALPGVLLFLSSHPTAVSRPKKYKSATGRTESFSFSCALVALISILSFFVPTITGIAQHLPGYAVSLGYTPTTGALMVSSVMLGNVLFKLLIGVLSDKIGPVNASLIILILNLLSLIGLSQVSFIQDSRKLIQMSSFLFGTVYAVGAVGISLIVRLLFGQEGYIALYPYMNLLISLGSAASLTLNGFLFDLFGSYRVSFISIMMIAAVCIMLLLLLRLVFKHQKNEVSSGEVLAVK